MRLLFPLLLLACTDTTTPDEPVEGELITTVELSFTPASGGDAEVFTWAETDGDAVVDDITLSDAEDYTLSVRFLDELSTPVEDVTEEVADEADEHQVFFTGDALDGLLVHRYADEDANGLPVGLDNEVDTEAEGSGTLTVTLRHLPPEGNAVVKVAGLEDEVASGGLSSIGGDSDVSVDFAVVVGAR